MNLKKLFSRKIFRNKKLKQLRNFIGIRPSFDIISYDEKNISVSDAFFWRTDNGFKTIFKFTNLVSFFYRELEKEIRIVFYDSKNNFIKEVYINGKEKNSIIIDKKYLNNMESYGVFYVFHNTDVDINSIIRNSCYTAFSLNNSLPSFVHGNTITAQKKLNAEKINFGLGGISLFKKRTYHVQNYFEHDKKEIMLVNPTKKRIIIKINNLDLTLNTGCSILLDLKNEKFIKITSKCYLLRPIIFSYNKSYFDVHHG